MIHDPVVDVILSSSQSQTGEKSSSSSGKTSPLIVRKTMSFLQKKILIAVVLIAIGSWFFVLPGLMRMSGIQFAMRDLSITESEQVKRNPEAVHKERISSMRRVCQQLVEQNRSSTILPDSTKLQYNIYFNDDYKFIYCSVPKIACTNWKRLLLSMAGFGKPEDISTSDIYNSNGKYFKTLHSMQLNNLDHQEALKRIQTYKKFIFVREPYERLLSAWRNKFTQWSNAEMHERYGRRIIEKFRQSASQTSMDGGHDVTFAEFLQFILDPQTTTDGMQNEHWDSYEHLCYPCALQYDYIGKYESMSEDIDFILGKLNVTHIKMPDRGLYYHTIKTSEFLNLAYKEVPEELIKGVWNDYYNDFTTFGYPYQSFQSEEQLYG